MALVSYGITRNVKAQDAHGRAVKIAMVVIKHENGTEQTLAINEDFIRFAGEDVIEKEVLAASRR